ncbi:MAG: hypothetical protein HY735_19790 [Verrucomicrobia bacterium]|nr:hypothetical protein [Verrucomicrobiota bacterium]
MKVLSYMQQKPAVALVAGLGGFFTIVDLADAQPWAATDAPVQPWKALAASADGTRLVAAANARSYFGGPPAPIFVSTNAGAHWTQTIAPSNNWSSVASSADGSKLAGDAGGDIYISTNSGVTWTRSDTPAMSNYGVAISGDGSNIVAVGYGSIFTLRPPAPGPPLPPPPQMSIDPLGANFSLSWLVPSTRFVLQQSADLRSANWVDALASPTLDFTSLNHRVTLAPSSSGSFYRLKQQ